MGTGPHPKPRSEPRRKLCGGGLSDLADAIRGHNGRYILSL